MGAMQICGMLQTAVESDTPRRVPGRPFPKGVSGNPGGRRGERIVDGKTLAELARSMTHEALAAVRTVLADPAVSHAIRLQAADIVLRRGWGDAPRESQVEQELTVIVKTLHATPTPVAGVINHPDRRYVCLPSVQRVDEVEQ
ncbi:MAG: hypothetical protein QM722_15065 [Piscinibacter sp.]